jgi:hypothetical protein
MWREMARPALRDTVRRWAALTAVDVENSRGPHPLAGRPAGTGRR